MNKKTKRKYVRKNVDKLPLYDDIPMPNRGETEELAKLKILVKNTVPGMRVARDRFNVDKPKAHTIMKFLSTEFPDMKFKSGKIKGNDKILSFWRKR